ncbi:bomanin-1-like [Drosophila innubila]|uniref:bomanin-1-like n=1 Tax=Drosophila innubila TaxID=198719 RepID=UPI00148D9B14|nr:bomanin-1-like [Drosophila innubila]
MKFFSVVFVLVLVLLALASALPLSPDNDIIMNGACKDCLIIKGQLSETLKVLTELKSKLDLDVDL